MTVDLKEIEKRLNNEPNYQRRFLNDPVGLLRDEGLEVTDTIAKNLNDFVKNLSGGQPAVAGSNLAANPQEVGIGISIGKSF